MTILLARVVETCSASPAQWDAWTTTGQYLYLRYRWGIGTVEEQPDPDPDTWDDREPIATFGERGGPGAISIEEFCAAAGLALAPGVAVE